MMTKKQEFVDFIEKLMAAAPNVEMSENVKTYFEIFKGSESNKPAFTENGKLVLKFLQEHVDKDMWKAKEIGEELFVSSRTVAGSMRKLVSDGYVEKIGQDPVVYSITEKGKKVVFEEEVGE